MIFAIDFDGTIVSGEEYPAIGKERPLATYVIKCLLNNGHQVILWTCRQGHLLFEAKEWLNEKGVYPTTINNNTPENLVEHKGIDNRKIYADYYLDDKNWPAFTDWYHFLIDMIVSGALPSECITGVKDPGEG